MTKYININLLVLERFGVRKHYFQTYTYKGHAYTSNLFDLVKYMPSEYRAHFNIESLYNNGVGSLITV